VTQRSPEEAKHVPVCLGELAGISSKAILDPLHELITCSRALYAIGSGSDSPFKTLRVLVVGLSSSDPPKMEKISEEHQNFNPFLSGLG
jgi:hypothetical protein